MKTEAQPFPRVVVKKEAKVEELASSESDASYLDDEESTSGETSNSISADSDGGMSDDVEMLAQEVTQSEQSEEEKQMASGLYQFIKARHDYSKTKSLALFLAVEITLLVRHKWLNDEVKIASLYRTTLKLIVRIKHILMCSPEKYHLEWLESLDLSSLQPVKGSQLKEVLEGALGPQESRNFMPHAFDLDTAKTTVHFIRRAFCQKTAGDEEEEEGVGEDDNEEEVEVDELYQVVLSYKPDFYRDELIGEFVDRESPFTRLVKTLCKMVEDKGQNHSAQLIQVIGEVAALAREYDTLQWFLKYARYKGSPLDLRGEKALLKVIVKAIKYASSFEEADDKVKKQCRLIVRFFRTAYLCKSCGQGVPA